MSIPPRRPVSPPIMISSWARSVRAGMETFEKMTEHKKRFFFFKTKKRQKKAKKDKQKNEGKKKGDGGGGGEGHLMCLYRG